MATVTLPRWLLYALVLALGMSLAFAAGSMQRASGDNHDTTYYACLYAGSLSQVGTTEPANCGRGTSINWNTIPPEGVSGYVPVESDPVTLLAGEEGAVFATCPDDTVLLGGGIVWTESAGVATNQEVHIMSNGPNTDTSWTGYVRNDGQDSNTFVVRILCATQAPV